MFHIQIPGYRALQLEVSPHPRPEREAGRGPEQVQQRHLDPVQTLQAALHRQPGV